ncbi:MAG: tetratricopeptide repeat protein [Clostridia bacterium]|nr:tetratricopeptide repeat protein [Clostridia bacterium]
MSKCAHCGESLVETPRLSFCPSCSDCFIPGSIIPPDVDEEETFSRMRGFLNEHGDNGRLMILGREPGTGCTTALYALATHRLIPQSLPDFTAFYFDAHRPSFRMMSDYRTFLRAAIRSYSPRYEEPDADDAAACTRMLSDLNEQILMRSARKKLLLFISLPDQLPEDFLRSLPRGRALPKRTGVFLVCTTNTADRLKRMLPRAQVLPPIERGSDLHIRAIRRMMTQTFCPNLRHRLMGGMRNVEAAIAAVDGDFHRAYLLRSLYTEHHAIQPHTIPEPEDLWTVAIQFFADKWGEERLRRVAALALMLVLWGHPLPPTMLPHLCGVPVSALEDALRLPELLRVGMQEDTPIVSISCKEPVAALRARFPDLLSELAVRIMDLAEDRVPLELPPGGLCRFFCGAPYALARWNKPELLNRLLDQNNTAAMHRKLNAQLGTGITEAELEQVWTSRIWFARENDSLLLRLESTQYRRALHQKQDRPAAEAEDLSELLDALQPAFQNHPDGRMLLSRLYEQRAQCNIRATRARSALEDFDRAVRFATPFEGALTDVNRLARLLLARGEFELQHKLFEQALDDCNRSLKLVQYSDLPDMETHQTALMTRAQIYACQRKNREALYDLNHLCTILSEGPDAVHNPLRCKAYMLLGELYDKEKDPLKAAAAYSRVVEYYRFLSHRDPAYIIPLSEAYSARADSYERNENWDCSYVDRCTAIDTLVGEVAPDGLPLETLARAYMKRAIMLRDRARYEEAIADCSAAIDLLEPTVSATNRSATSLCLALYRERDRMYTHLEYNARALEDRRRIAQLQILLR